MAHTESHPLAGQTVKLRPIPGGVDLNSGIVADNEYRIEDWWDKLTGGSWADAEGNPAAIKYAVRISFSPKALDLLDPTTIDEVVYGKIGPYGQLIHASELGEVVVPDRGTKNASQ